MADWNIDYRLVRERLAQIGIRVTDIYLLATDASQLRRAVPVLGDLLSEVKTVRVKRELAQVLQDAPETAPVLLGELKRIRSAVARGDDQSRAVAWTVANSLSETAGPELFDDIVTLFGDAGLGRARQMLAYGIARTKSRRADALRVLTGALEDPDVVLQSLDALGKAKMQEAEPKIRDCIQSADVSIRRMATRA
jgi:HEAT repeat protein